MVNAANRRFTAKSTLLASIVVLIMSSLLLIGLKPASAGTSFSIGIGFGGGQVVYRSWSGGGYRHYHPGWTDEYHVWHPAYYYGPVVYNAPYDAYYWDNGSPHYYHHFRGAYGGGYGGGGGWSHGYGGGGNHYGGGGWQHNGGGWNHDGGGNYGGGGRHDH